MSQEQIISSRPPLKRQEVESTDLDIRDLSSATDDVSVTTVKPDGTNIMPSLDDISRAGFVKLTNGTNTASVDSDGHLDVHVMNDGLSIASGEVAGATFVHKFGQTPDFDTTDGSVYVWDGANDGGSNQMQYTFSATADIDRISSSNSGDTQDIEIQGLDTNYDLVTQTITLTGQTPASLTTSLIRVFRMKNVNSTDLAGTVYCFVNGATTGGVPDDLTTVRAEINNGNNQTLMAIYTIPNGKTGYLRSWFAATAGALKTSNYIIDLFARPFGQVFQLKHRSALSETGTSHIQHTYVEPEIFGAKTDIIMKAQATAGGVTAASVAAGFDIVLIDD